MDSKTEFINLIDKGISIVRGLIQQNNYPIFHDRYEKIVTELEDLKDVTLKGVLYTKFRYLNVVNMLDYNDPEYLENIILEIDNCYCRYFRSVIS